MGQCLRWPHHSPRNAWVKMVRQIRASECHREPGDTLPFTRGRPPASGWSAGGGSSQTAKRGGRKRPPGSTSCDPLSRMFDAGTVVGAAVEDAGLGVAAAGSGVVAAWTAVFGGEDGSSRQTTPLPLADPAVRAAGAVPAAVRLACRATDAGAAGHRTPAARRRAVARAALGVLRAALVRALAGVGARRSPVQRQRADNDRTGEAAQRLPPRPDLTKAPDESIKSLGIHCPALLVSVVGTEEHTHPGTQQGAQAGCAGSAIAARATVEYLCAGCLTV
jgi:hypothetical protein